MAFYQKKPDIIILQLESFIDIGRVRGVHTDIESIPNFKAFEDHEFDILLGTQMIAKGLNFPDVTVVGVVSLDKALFTGDYRSYERSFSLLTQVAGRCGRGIKPGKAYIQTFVPDHYVINFAAAQDYDGFFREEAALRKTLIYPPFCDICVFGFSSTMESKTLEAANWASMRIAQFIKENKVDFPLRAFWNFGRRTETSPIGQTFPSKSRRSASS